jgi:hypothetical protein
VKGRGQRSHGMKQSSLLIFLLLPCSFAIAATSSEFARKCGVEASVSSARVFADSGDGKWKHYPNPKAVPEGNPDWSETAFMWGKSSSSPVLIAITGMGQDFADYTSYCFDRSGNLIGLDREFRTAWGWGFAEKRSYGKYGNEIIDSHFFSTKTKQQIPRPEGADDVPEALQVKLYKKLSEIPFSKLATRE